MGCHVQAQRRSEEGGAVTPAEELRTAAARLREMAAAAKDGPWTVREEHGRDITDEAWSEVRVVAPSGDVAITYMSSVLEGDPHEDNAAYIAAMGPHVAEPLAGWLDDEACLADMLAADGAVYNGTRPALKVARSVPGTSPEQAAGEGR